jgi:NADH-quinone oxidoreductase subunit L
MTSHWLGWIPGLPLAGFAALTLFGGWLSRRAIATVAISTTALSAVLALAAAVSYPGQPVTQSLWSFLRVGELQVDVGLRLDALSAVMTLVVAVVGLLIHLYASEYMRDDEGYRRFFATMNLFMAAMLTLVLADDLLVLYIGWEGVGLCSYLLIGFWYRDPDNGRAARKAFLVTRIGDAALAVGLFLLYSRLGTLDIATLLQRASERFAPGAPIAVACAGLLLAGALGKSAQLPLHTWLPDAMAGPTPVSALIHAATMVAAGVYLVARTEALFALAPPVMHLVAAIGALTLLFAAAAALAQRDIKRILAYSTMSQVGYMFLALGAGSVSAGIFHFLTHAFFKSLLFLGAGVVIAACGDEHDVFAMGGLRRDQPLTFWCFLAGAAALGGLPVVSSGFYSKDWILSEAFRASPWLWGAGWVGAALTALYSFRLVFLVFFGEGRKRKREGYRAGLRVRLPLVVLAVLALVAGLLETPSALGGVRLFSRWMAPVGIGAATEAPIPETALVVLSSLAALAGLALAYLVYFRRRDWLERLGASDASALARWGLAGFRIDDLYRFVVVRPFEALARASAGDVADGIYAGLARAAVVAHRLLSRTESGQTRWYAGGIAAGAVVFLTWVLWTL